MNAGYVAYQFYKYSKYGPDDKLILTDGTFTDGATNWSYNHDGSFYVELTDRQLGHLIFLAPGKTIRWMRSRGRAPNEALGYYPEDVRPFGFRVVNATSNGFSFTASDLGTVANQEHYSISIFDPSQLALGAAVYNWTITDYLGNVVSKTGTSTDFMASLDQPFTLRIDRTRNGLTDVVTLDERGNDFARSAGNAFLYSALFDPEWMTDGNGSFDTMTNWKLAYRPNGQGQTAKFGPTNTSARTISIDSPTTLGALKFDSPNGYTLAGTSTLTIWNDTGTFQPNVSKLQVSSGSHSISAALLIKGDTLATVAAGASLTVAGSFATTYYNPDGWYPTSTLTKEGAGSLTISGPQAHGIGSQIIVNGGLLNMNTDAGPGTAGGTLALSVSNTALVNFNAPQHLAALTVADGMAIAAWSGSGTLSVPTLNVSGTGLLDLQNHHLLVDNTATPVAKVKQYIDAAYNRNVGTGIGDYNGRGGITSTVVKNNGDFMGVGYYDGALQDPANPDNVGQIYGPHRNDPTPVGIPLNQILIRPTLTGDLNGDGLVNTSDVVQFNSYGLFGSPTNLGYQAGDLNGDGIVNAKDVTIFNSAGNFNNGSYLVAKAATTLTGHSASPATTELNPASGTLAFSYDPATGDVKVNYHGFTGFANKPTFNSGTRLLSLIDIASTGGIFALDSTKLAKAATDALSSPTITGNTEINLTAVNGYLPDGTDIGRILAPGLDPVQLANALTLTFNYTGSRNTSGGVAGLIVPEPATLSLLGFGALGLLARRRRTPARN